MTAYPLQFREAYTHQFNIPEYLQPQLALYKRLNWTAEFFLKQWESNIGTYAAGTIRRYNQIFHVQFAAGCNIGRMKDLSKYYPDCQLILSFRAAKGMPAFVLVDFLAGQFTEAQGE